MKKLIVAMMALAIAVGASAQTANNTQALKKNSKTVEMKQAKTQTAKVSTTKAAATQVKTKKSTASNVYYTTAKGATAYHKNKNCRYIKNDSKVKSTTVANAKKLGRTACKACYPAGKTKVATSKTTTGKTTIQGNMNVMSTQPQKKQTSVSKKSVTDVRKK